jgi:hypothetical protein
MLNLRRLRGTVNTSRDLIAAFIRELAPEQFCAACLAFEADVGLEESRQVVASLALTDPFTLRVGECDGCTRQVPVLSAKPSPSTE